MRRRIYQIIRYDNTNDQFGQLYNAFIIMISLMSIIPLMFQNVTGFWEILLNRLDTVTVYLLFLDYILCWMTHDYKAKKHSPWAFLTYPFTPLALMNMLAILPSLGLLPAQLAVLRLFRLVKILQYSKSCRHIVTVFRKEKKTLLSVLMIAVFYIFISALIMYSVEPQETFNDFFHSLYWATTALTTVGYGDVYPVTDLGRLISMVSSLFGIAVIALPAGIVTAGFVDALSEESAALDKEEELLSDEKLLEQEVSDTEKLEQLLLRQQASIDQLQQQLSKLRQDLCVPSATDTKGGTAE